MSPIRSILGLTLALASFSSAACGPVGNLVENCSFDVDLAGYTAQEGGDVIQHEASAGNLAAGAMRVTDTDADSGSQAEAESCINLGTERGYRLSASFRAVSADTCLLGWDEYLGTDCTQPNGMFVASAAAAVNNKAFTTLTTHQSSGSLVYSVELVILCDGTAGQTEYLVDDVHLVPELLFRNGFEG